MSDTCTYCGATARAWQGAISWCGSDACSIRHEWATSYPEFRIWMEPTYLDRAWAAVVWAGFRFACCVVPIRWIMYKHKGTRRQAVAVWAYGGAYWWAERKAGRV